MKTIYAVFVLLIGMALNVSAGIFNANIIVNGNAEAGAGSPDGDTLAVIPGWTRSGNLNVNTFGAGGDSIPLPANESESLGSNFFAGGANNALSSATQTIDVSAGAQLIDTGLVSAELSGMLGGFSSQDDHAILNAAFLSAGNATLAQMSIGPVLAADRTNVTVFLFRANTNNVPVGTRQILVTLTMTRDAGNYNDGYADNLSLVLRDLPMLQIAGLPGGKVALSWSTNYPGFRLQTTTNLAQAGTNWNNATNVISTSGAFFLTTNQTSPGAQFFRLINP